MVYFAFSLAVVAGTSALLFYMRLLSKTQELEKALQECARLLTHSNKLESSYTESLQDIARLETLLQTTKKQANTAACSPVPRAAKAPRLPT